MKRIKSMSVLTTTLVVSLSLLAIWLDMRVLGDMYKTRPKFDTPSTESSIVTNTTEATLPTSSTEEKSTEATSPIEESTIPTEFIETTNPTTGYIENIVLDSLYCDTSSELDMLACVIYQEVGGNAYCDMCRYRVADIVLNRIEHEGFPNTMYGVLTQYRQYGRFYWTGIKWPSRALSEEESIAVSKAYKVAEDVLSGNHGELYGKGYIWQAEFVQGTSGFWCCGHYYGK